MATREQLYTALRNADAAGDTAAAQKLASYIKSMPQDAATPAAAPAPAPTEQPSFGQQFMTEVKESLPGRAVRAIPDLAAGALRGAGSIGATILGARDAAEQGLANMIGADGYVAGNSNRREEMTQALGAMGADTGSLAFGTGKLFGEVAGTAGAGGALGNALARVPGAATAMPGVINALRTGGMTTGQTVAPGIIGAVRDLGARALGGAATGGVSAGLVDPEQAGMGAAVGGALPIATRVAGGVGSAVGRGVRSLAEPFYARGQEAIVGRALNRAAGSDAAAVAQRLADSAAPFVGPSQGAQRTVMGELVPGSLPTVGQAAQNPGVAALERAATATNPEVASAMAEQFASQNAARVGVLDDLAGSQGAREFFDANRSATAQQLYDAAYEKGINLSRNASTGAFQSKAQVAGTKGEITKLLQRPAIQDAMKEARKLAANEGVKLTDPAGSVKGLDYVKRALDDQIGKATGNEQRVLTELKSRLLTTIDRLSPDYAAARTSFAEMSRPINQMDVAQTIRDKSVNALTGNLQPAAFARSFSDDTAAAATGFRKATLDNTLEPAQLNRLNMLLDDVVRSNAAQNAGRGPGSDTVQKLAYTNILDQSGVPTMIRDLAPAQFAGNLLARAGDVAYARQNRELANRLAEIMQDPANAARVMQLAQRGGPATQNALAQLMGGSAQQLGYRAAPVLAASGR